jgi:catechol 2,3-dioxygenase-like lactoylglutathione lyase family enzyme
MAGVPKLDRVIETCLHVEDVDRSAGFYERVLGLQALTGDARFRAFDVGGESVLLLFRRGGTLESVHLPGGTVPPHDGAGKLHIAFAIATDALAEWEQHLVDHHVAVESKVRWPLGGSSLYFRDPDEHLLELATPGLWATY